MKILLTNDDGINAQGIQTLINKLVNLGQIYVVAPEGERSASSQAITMNRPIRVDEINYNIENVKAWSISGTPTDCVKLAIETLLPEKPDLVISGINAGPNMGNDVLYSGTVSAAIEGALHKIPSIAISLNKWQDCDFSYAAEFIWKFVDKNFKNDWQDSTLLNINIPAVAEEVIAGVKVTKLGERKYANAFHRRQDPRGRIYYWMGGEIVDSGNGEDTDIYALKNNYISITPIHFDLTDYEAVNNLRKWQLDIK